MKKMLLSIALVATSYLAADDALPIIDMSKVDLTQFETFLSSDKEGIIFSFPNGLKIPFKINVSGDVLSLSMEETAPLVFNFERTLYLKFTNDELFLSTDLQSWTSVDEFFTGELKCKLRFTEEGGAFAQYDILMNERKADESEENSESQE